MAKGKTRLEAITDAIAAAPVDHKLIKAFDAVEDQKELIAKRKDALEATEEFELLVKAKNQLKDLKDDLLDVFNEFKEAKGQLKIVFKNSPN